MSTLLFGAGCDKANSVAALQQLLFLSGCSNGRTLLCLQDLPCIELVKISSGMQTFPVYRSHVPHSQLRPAHGQLTLLALTKTRGD